MARSWKCRLRLHEWDERENLKTKGTCEVWIRCDAKTRAALGADAARQRLCLALHLTTPGAGGKGQNTTREGTTNAQWER